MEYITPWIFSIGATALILFIIFLVIKHSPSEPIPYKQKNCTCDLGRVDCYAHLWATAQRDGVRVHSDYNEILKCPKEQEKLQRAIDSIETKRKRNK